MMPAPFSIEEVTRAPRMPFSMRAAMRFIAASISASDVFRSATGRYVRSMSTEKRGMFRTKRLMAVPPFRAKQASSATKGSTRMRSPAFCRYSSDAAIEILGDRDVVFRVELAAAHEHALALAEVNGGTVYFLKPRMIVAVREPEEQALDLDVLAVGEERLKPLRAQVAKPFHQDIHLMKCLAFGNLIEQFEDRPLRRGHGERPVLLSPGFLRDCRFL